MFSHCDRKQDFWTLPWIQSEIFCLRAGFLQCVLSPRMNVPILNSEIHTNKPQEQL